MVARLGGPGRYTITRKSKPDTKSIPHYLKPLGYRVALLGKSHVGPKQAYPFEYIAGRNKSQDQNQHYLEETRAFLDSCQSENKPFCPVYRVERLARAVHYW